MIDLTVPAVRYCVSKSVDNASTRKRTVYRRPDDGLIERLRQKAKMLGSGTVRVHELSLARGRLAAMPDPGT
jgi:hypothetical protein